MYNHVYAKLFGGHVIIHSCYSFICLIYLLLSIAWYACIQVINVSRNLLCLNHLFVIIKICKESHGKIDTTQCGQNLYPCMDKIALVNFNKRRYLSHAKIEQKFHKTFINLSQEALSMAFQNDHYRPTLENIHKIIKPWIMINYITVIDECKFYKMYP